MLFLGGKTVASQSYRGIKTKACAILNLDSTASSAKAYCRFDPNIPLFEENLSRPSLLKGY